MDWTAQLFRYCERGADPAFWAEPANAISNSAFLIAAGFALLHAGRRPADAAQHGASAHFEYGLIGLVAIIGVGSFLFHTFATEWAALADVIPIGIFMLAYLGYALHRFLGLPAVVTAAGLILFVLALLAFAQIDCQPGFMPVSNALGVDCFNGTLGYVPALIALLAIGGVLIRRGHPAGCVLAASGLIFAVSMLFRAFDFELCTATPAGLSAGRLGTHFVWHLLNALMLYLLLRAAVLHGFQPKRG